MVTFLGNLSLSLADVPVGQQALIEDILEPGAAGERLLQMGLTPGTMLTLIRRTQALNLLQIELRGYMLSLPQSAARNIRVTNLGSSNDISPPGT